MKHKDAECTALFRGGEQAFWMRRFHEQIGTSLTDPILLYCDNESATAIAKGEGPRSKAIRVETCVVRDRIR